MEKDDVNLWRINTHVHEDNHYEVVQYCIKNKIIGIGWRTEKEINEALNGNDNFVEKEIKEKKYSRESVKRAFNAFNKIKEDDLIWTRAENIYYLGRVIGPKKHYFQSKLNAKEYKEHDENDIWHTIGCEWIKIGNMTTIYGTIVNSFNCGTMCEIKTDHYNALNYSKKIYNEKSKKQHYYCEKLTNDSIIKQFDSERLEALVNLYLQMEKNYYVLTNTCKKSTKTTECILISKDDNKFVYVQTKTGKIDLSLKQYSEIYNNGHDFYFFSATGNYTVHYDNKGQNEHDLEKFVKENEHVKIIEQKNLEKFNKKNKSIKHI